MDIKELLASGTLDNNLVIIVPCYKEEHRLPVDEFLNFSLQNTQISFLFVNDGSSDNTIEVLLKMKEKRDNIFVLDNKQNEGKAGAVRSAVKYAIENFNFKYIGFFDADLATPLFEINNLEKIIPQSDYLMIACSRIKRLGSTIERNPMRFLTGRIFATATSRILMLPVYDTQCGAKIIRKDVAEIIFKDSFNSRWFFDIELFARIILNFGYNKAIKGIFEYPMVQWLEKGDSRITAKDFLKTPLELFKLNKFYHKKIKQKFLEPV